MGEYCKKVKCPWLQDNVCTSPNDHTKNSNGEIECDFDRGIFPFNKNENMDTIKKLGDDYGLTPEGVRHAIETYQTIICEITGGKLSKLTYDVDFILETAEEHYRWKYKQEDDIIDEYTP